MSNANRDYAIVYDVKNGSLVLSRPLIFYITDKNTSNIFIKLVKKISIGNEIDEYTDIEDASNYILTMRVIKPNNEIKNIEAIQHKPECVFQFDLTEDFKDIPGKYICELTVSAIVSSRQELITSDPFSYEVKRSILSNVGEIIETEDTTVEKLLSNLDATKAELSSQIKEINTKIDSWHSEGNVGTSTSIRVNNQLFTNENGIITLPDYPTITFNDFTTEQTATEKILKFKGGEIFRCSLQVPGSSEVTTHTVTNNLTNCKTNNNATSINSGSVYTATITANSGYTVNTITVTMGGVNVTNSVVSGANISISNVTGNIVITASAVTTTTNYNVTRNLSNCSCSNSASSITSGSSYSTTLSPNNGYTISSITVTMGGVDVTNTVVLDNSINIPSVTGNIVINATAILSSTDEEVSILRDNIDTSTQIGTISSYENRTLKLNSVSGTKVGFSLKDLALEDNTNYKLTCSFDKTNSTSFGSVDTWEVYTSGIRFQINTGTDCNEMSLIFNSESWSTASSPYVACAVKGNAVTGLSIFNNIRLIKMDSGINKYTIRNNFSNVSTNNINSIIQENETYEATITANTGYEMSFITVTMGGVDITSQVVSGNSINISSVTGNIVINAAATPSSQDNTTYEVTNNLTNCSSNNSNTTVKANHSYEATLSPNDGYTISSITVTIGGVDVTNTVVLDNSINIPSVTGNIIITAIADNSGNVPSDDPIGDVSILSYDLTTVPQITHYYYPGKQKVSNSETIIPIYITDYYQREYHYEDTSLRFDLRVEVDGQVKWIRNLQAGDHDVSLGVLGVGEHDYSLEVTQTNNGLRSQRLFNKVWVVDDTNDITAAQTYNVTSSDLTRHNITLDLTSSATATQLRNNRLGLTSLFEEYHNKGYRKIVLPANCYIRVNMMYAGETETYPETWDKRIMPKPILIPTNTTIDMNGSTIKMERFSDTDYPIEEGKEPEIAHVTNEIIRFVNCIDSHLINGTIEGNYAERLENPSVYLNKSNGEHDGGITMYGGGWNTLENFTIKQISGYNLSCAKNPDIGQINGIWLQNSSSYPAGFEGCWDKFVNTDLVKGVETPKQNRLTSDFISLSSFKYDFFSVGAPGSSYPTGYYYEVLCTFYDENKQYIDDFIAYQARVCKLPAGAKYARFTLNEANYDDISNKGFFVFPGTRYYSEYNEWKNIEFIDNRTCCNPNMFKHLRMTNCNFTRSGQSITPLAIDSEDGGAGMQDLFIDHCSIKEHATTQTGDCVSVGGLNVVIQDNTNMSFGIRAEVVGATLRNNTCSRRNSEIQKGWRTRNTVRCYNNEFKGWNEAKTSPIVLSVGLNSVYKSKDAQLMIKGCRNFNYGNGNDTNTMLRQNLILKDCEDLQMGAWVHHINNTFYINSQETDNPHRTGNGTFDKCTFTRKATGGSTNTKILSFNYGSSIESIGTYNDCIFNFPDSTTTVQPDIQNAFVKGEFNNCTFKTPMIFKLLYANNMGDIKFNNCKFEAELTLDLRDTKVQFNECTFNGITYLNNGQANSQFN